MATATEDSLLEEILYGPATVFDGMGKVWSTSRGMRYLVKVEKALDGKGDQLRKEDDEVFGEQWGWWVTWSDKPPSGP